jgi:hypothetical protein
MAGWVFPNDGSTGETAQVGKQPFVEPEAASSDQAHVYNVIRVGAKVIVIS